MVFNETVTYVSEHPSPIYPGHTSGRATTVLIVAAALPSPSFFLGAQATKQSILASPPYGLLRFARNDEEEDSSLPGLTRQSGFFPERWMAGSSPGMTRDGPVKTAGPFINLLV
jgi:hypothetical protein